MPRDRYKNPGRMPTRWPEDTQVRVEWANGRTAINGYLVKQPRWSLTGSEWDIHTFWKE